MSNMNEAVLFAKLLDNRTTQPNNNAFYAFLVIVCLMIYYKQNDQHQKQPSYIPYPVYRNIPQQQYQPKSERLQIETFSDILKPPWQLLY
jgi:hypothetical protein